MKAGHRWLILGLGTLVALCLLAPVAGARSTHLISAAAQGQWWRHGVVPRRGPRNAAGLASSTALLSYGGGISDGTNNVGVTTGQPRVYLVFWGSQWGSQSANSSGYDAYSGDPSGVAPDLQAFFAGLGTGGETWSGVMTQYCQGLSNGATSCPASAQHVGYPSGGALAGVWEDASAAAPSQASATQIAQEAINAATHFGNTTQSSNRDTQYFIVSPHGTNPDNWRNSGFCAWHDYTGDSYGISNPDGWLAFTNLPYIPDAGTSCGQNFVNSGSGGTLDGVTIVGGHEYAETITDQYPAGGWTDSSGNEDGDKCAWISSGPGASQDITLTTGAFAVQSTWANDFNGGAGGCEVTHSIVANGPSVSNPGNQTTSVGRTAAVVQMNATEPDGSSCSSCTYQATGLPSGITISSSGLISGTAPTTAGTSNVTVTATDSTGATGSTSFTWSVVAGPATSLSVSPSTVTMTVGSTQVFTASGKDQYGNPASLSGVSWSASGGGSVSPASGGSTTFTATATPGANVTATLGSLVAPSSVTINPAPANAVSNGGFESGALSPWTWSGSYAAVIRSTLCHGGSYCAQLGKATPTNGNSNIVQSFKAPSGTPGLTFYYKVVCLDTVYYDWATATLRDATTGTTTTILPHTCTNNGAWVKVSKSLTGGHQYTLTLTSHDDNYPGDPTYTLYDDVSVH